VASPWVTGEVLSALFLIVEDLFEHEIEHLIQDFLVLVDLVLELVVEDVFLGEGQGCSACDGCPVVIEQDDDLVPECFFEFPEVCLCDLLWS